MSSPGVLEHGLNHQRSAVAVRGSALLLLSFQALGVIYSDIGTSPLYVLNGMWPASGPVPPNEDIIGGVSAIVWSLTLLPLIKYIFISLQFGTREGEGGTFALFQGLFPPDDNNDDEDRTLTGDSFNKFNTEKTSGRGKLRQSLRWPLLVWCLLGTALTMADGIFTPAVSVTSAVGGIAVAKASVSADIIPISIALLVFLFIVQRFGTAKIAFLFAPISLIWFILIAVCGIYNITYHPGIFRAFDPSRAVMFFVRTRNYDLLAGVLLALTGCEAVFANLGQFNALSIRLSFGTFVYPALVLAYLGQGARLIVGGEAVLSNVFYQTIPGPTNGVLFWIILVFSILATFIASQAMVSATFSLVQQIVNMKSLPPLRMVYTSETTQGQVYIPAVNWALMIATIVIVATFKNAAALTNAYGFSVATVMFSTTILLAVQMRYVKMWPTTVAIGYLTIWGFFDGLFWGASLKKVPHGAWVPLMLGLILMSLMFFWTWAKRLEDQFSSDNRRNLRHFIHTNEKDEIQLNSNTNDQVNEEENEEEKEDELIQPPSYYYLSYHSQRPSLTEPAEKNEPQEEKHDLVRIHTCAIFHKLAKGKGVPYTFVGFIRQWPALPRVVIFLSVSILPVARVDPLQKYAVSKVKTVEGFYGVTYYVGFRDDFDVKIDDIISRICGLEMQIDSRNCAQVIREIKQASRSTTHIVPHYDVISKKISFGPRGLSFVVNWFRSLLIEGIYNRLATMFPETANWLTSADEIIRVGISASM